MIIHINEVSCSVLVFAASAKVASLGSCSFAAPVRSIRFNFDKVYVALADCMLQVFKRSEGSYSHNGFALRTLICLFQMELGISDHLLQYNAHHRALYTVPRNYPVK